MASYPPSQCCAKGFKHNGTPQGKSLKIGQHDAYLSIALSGNVKEKTGILYLSDALGIWDNSKLLADQFAAQGYSTLMIDLFNGDALKLNQAEGLDLQTWISHGRDHKGPHTPKEIDPIVEQALGYMRNELGFERIGSVGYCFGAKYVVRHYSNGIQAAFLAHPSFVDEEELARVNGPISIAAAEIDDIFTVQKRQKTEEILTGNGIVYQLNLYSRVEHGFATRCDLSQKWQRFAKKQAFFQAVNFFDLWLE
ncbi:dienelactone hydrolase [Stachybotrys elegans]|uniref:Dienelactone hydrolase n=1 Tax=Stachybotrys elegans TaxID=80388 RepID=A0A8K0WLH1_9HYPO|nr:dienelactone hydrolase [Stachybotrys elegans]